MLQMTTRRPPRSLGDRAHDTWSALRERARSRRMLAGMSERELRDIGISDADRKFALGEPFWHEVLEQPGRERIRRQQRLAQFP